MKALVKITDGVTLEVEGTDAKDVLYEVGQICNYPKKCDCGNTSIFTISSNKDKEGNVYVAILCLKCYAKANLGSLKKGGYWWKRDFIKYEKKEDSKNDRQYDEDPPLDDSDLEEL